MIGVPNNPIKIGDKIELIHSKSATGRKLSEKKYGSKLMDYDGLHTGKIAMPIFEGRIIPLEVGDEYELCFFAASGMYQCTVKIVRRMMEKNIYVLKIEFITMPKKFQRRGFYRLDCMIPIRQRMIPQDEIVLRDRLVKNDFESESERIRCQHLLDEITPDWEDAAVSDISGGGIRFHSKHEWKQSDVIELVLPLLIKEDVNPVRVKINVISCIHYADSRLFFETRGEYVDLDDNDRELIVKYVFEEQRRRLRKE